MKIIYFLKSVVLKELFPEQRKKEQKLSDIPPVQILDNNDKLKEKLFITEDFNNNKIIYMLIDHMDPKILINEHKIQKSEYDSIVSEIQKNFETSKIAPGEMVGVLLHKVLENLLHK